MEPKDILTLIIAGYGAVLATYLGYREWTREKRRIKLFLERVEIVERTRLLIFNSGHRPVVITSIGLKLEHGPEEGGKPYLVPFYTQFISEETNFPVILHEGEVKNLEILSPTSEDMIYLKFEFSVYDIEGNIYKTSELRSFDSKFGGYYKRK